MAKVFCEQERAELVKFQAAYEDKLDELQALKERIRKIETGRSRAQSAQERANAVISGEPTDGSLSSLQTQAGTLQTAVNVLHQAVVEQKRHLDMQLRIAGQQAYQDHKKRQQAQKKFDRALELIEEAIEDDGDAVADLLKQGFRGVNTLTTSDLLERWHRLRNRVTMGEVPTALREPAKKKALSKSAKGPKSATTLAEIPKGMGGGPVA